MAVWGVPLLHLALVAPVVWWGWGLAARPRVVVRRVALYSVGIGCLAPLAFELLGPTLAPLAPGLGACQMAVPAACLVLLLLALAALAPAYPLRRPLRLFALLTALGAVWLGCAPLLLRSNAFHLATARDDATLSQSTWWTCGAVALQPVLAAHGVVISEAEAAAWMPTWPGFGTLSCGFACGGARAGLRMRAHRWARYDLLPTLPLPAVVYIKINGVYHAATLTAASATEVTLADPVSGRRTLSRAEFEREWLRQVMAFTPAS